MRSTWLPCRSEALTTCRLLSRLYLVNAWQITPTAASGTSSLNNSPNGSHEISFNTNLSETARARADFIYKISPTLISISDTGLGQRSVVEDIETVLHKIEYWHQGSISSFKIMCRDGKGFWHKVGWDGKKTSLSPLNETDEQKARKKLPLERPK